MAVTDDWWLKDGELDADVVVVIPSNVDPVLRDAGLRAGSDYGKDSFLYFTIPSDPDFGPFPLLFLVKKAMKEIKVR